MYDLSLTLLVSTENLYCCCRQLYSIFAEIWFVQLQEAFLNRGVDKFDDHCKDDLRVEEGVEEIFEGDPYVTYRVPKRISDD